MGSHTSRTVRRRITGLILERIALTVLPWGAGALVLWSGLPWAVRWGGVPLAVLITWLTTRHALLPGWRRMRSGCGTLLALGRRRWGGLSLPETRYEAPIFPAGLAADLLVVSDLHITGRPDQHALEREAFDEDVHRFVDGLLPAMRPKACVLAGDLTDTGSSDAWRRLRARFARWREQGVDLMAVAGNHDVHYRRLEVAAERLGVPKVGGYFKALVSHPSSAGVCSHPADRTARRLAKLTGEALADTLAPRLRTSRRIGADFLLLDSNQRPSHSPASQAIGYVGRAQLARAQALLEARDTVRPLYLVLHHHLLPPGPAAREQAFLTCLDAPEVLAFAEQHHVEAVFHGHLHMPYVAHHSYHDAKGRRRNMRIVSCGSALYPAEGPFAAEVGAASAMAVHLRGGRIEHLGFVPANRVLADLRRRDHQGRLLPDQSTKVPESEASSSSIRASIPATDVSMSSGA